MLVCSLLWCSQLQGALAQDTTSYSWTGRCRNFQACTYRYTAHQSHFTDEEKQEEDFSADVELSCQSEGVYGTQSASLYCIKLWNVQLDSDVLKNASNNTEDTVDGTEERIEELQEFVNLMVKDAGDGTSRLSPQAGNFNDLLFAKDFCFVQTADGKIADVIYPQGENIQVANVKKSIASAFQANFRKDSAREEMDVSGAHRASYRYQPSAAGALSYTRTVTSSDVLYIAGVPDDLRLTNFDKEETASFDSSHTLQFAQGNMHVSLASLSSAQHASDWSRRRRATGQEPDYETFNGDIDLEEDISATGSYTLTKVECRTLSSRVFRSSNIPEDDINGMTRDSILAKVDQATTGKNRMAQLRRSLRSIPTALFQLHQDPDEQHKLATKIHSLLSLEANHGPLPGHTPAVRQVLAYVRKIRNADGANDIAMRQLLYSMLVLDGDQSAQKILVDIYSQLRRAGGESTELTSLTTYLAFLRNATMHTVERLHALVESNNDSLLLVLGSLAEFAPKEVQERVVSLLAARLSDRQDTDDVIHLLHSLGNTGSKAVVNVLLDYLKHEDLDVQLAAIPSLRMHISSERVQAALTQLLMMNKSEEMTEAVLETLLSAVHDHAQHPEAETDSAPLNTALVIAALQSGDPKLRNLVVLYLEYVGTEHAKQLVATLMEMEEGGPLPNNIEEKSHRHRRGSDWDEANSDYDVVAKLSSRRSDVLTYPLHKAYLYSKKIGIEKLYAQFAAGVFVGAAQSGQKYKIFAKALVQGHAFGRTATALHVEFLRRRNYTSVYQKIYAKVIGKVLKDEAGYVPLACIKWTKTLFQSSWLTLFYFEASVFIYVGTLDFDVRLEVTLGLHVKFCACEHNYTACATLVPTVTLRPSATASATLLSLARGGITVEGNFAYHIEPECCIKLNITCEQEYVGSGDLELEGKGSGDPKLERNRTLERWEEGSGDLCTAEVSNETCSKLWIGVTYCTAVYGSWPDSYVELYAYYQTRRFKSKWPPWKSYFYWSDKKKWDKLSTRWEIESSGRSLVGGSCNITITCP